MSPVNMERGYRGREIAIMSDSRKAIRALSSYAISSRLVWDRRGRFNQLGAHNRVTLYWVPGHMCVDGKEKAVEMATKGAETHFTGPEPFCSEYDQVVLKEREGEEQIRVLGNTPWDQAGENTSWGLRPAGGIGTA